MTPRLDLLERLADLAWGPAVARQVAEHRRLEHHLSEGGQVAVVTTGHRTAGLAAQVPDPDSVEGCVYDRTDLREHLEPLVEEVLPVRAEQPELITFTGDVVTDLWVYLPLDAEQTSVSGLRQAADALHDAVSTQVQWMQTTPAGGTSEDVERLIAHAEGTLAKVGYPSLPFRDWTSGWSSDGSRHGAQHSDHDPETWVFGEYPDFARWALRDANTFVEMNRARFPADGCVVEVSDDAVRMIGASGWLAFYLELPKPAGEADAAIVRALSRALTATLKVLDPQGLPRDIFGVHRPVTVTISQFTLEHAVWVEPPPVEQRRWPDRDRPLRPHERTTAALGGLLQDLRNDSAWTTLWHEIVEVLRWSRYGELDLR